MKILFVCTGNRCRSPMAAAALLAARGDLPIEPLSYGILDTGGAAPPREMVEAAAVLGLDLSGHRAQIGSRESAQGADLVLGFDWRHVAAAVVDWGVPGARTFTLPEFVELASGVDPEWEVDADNRGRRVVTRVHEMRSALGATGLPSGVTDPMGGHRRDYARAAQVIRVLCEQLLVGLFGLPNQISSRPARLVVAEARRSEETTTRPMERLEW